MGAGRLRAVGSVTEAAECLVASDWPRPHGAQHRAASRACRLTAGCCMFIRATHVTAATATNLIGMV